MDILQKDQPVSFSLKDRFFSACHGAKAIACWAWDIGPVGPPSGAACESWALGTILSPPVAFAINMVKPGAVERWIERDRVACNIS